MKKSGKLFSSFLLINLSLCLASCSVLSPEHSLRDLEETSSSYADLINSQPTIILSKHENSDFSQVNASFYVPKNKVDTFRVISDLSLSTQWFDRLKDIETLAFKNNNNFVLRSIISSPWPFTDRELITCVNTQFLDIETIITINNCPNEHPQTDSLIRIKHATSRWVITPIKLHQPLSIDKVLTKVTYQAWLEPNGYVPAFFFNQSLKSSSVKSLTALKHLIESN